MLEFFTTPGWVALFLVNIVGLGVSLAMFTSADDILWAGAIRRNNDGTRDRGGVANGILGVAFMTVLGITLSIALSVGLIVYNGYNIHQIVTTWAETKKPPSYWLTGSYVLALLASLALGPFGGFRT